MYSWVTFYTYISAVHNARKQVDRNKLIATFFGAGYSPIAPGTMGAILATIIAYLTQICIHNWYIFQLLFIFFIIIGTLLGVRASNNLENEWGKDPGKIVIDEAVGVWISFLFVPYGWEYLVGGLILFRVFDIWKPLHVGKAEQLPRGIGVMADDIVAGIYSLIILQIVIHFMNY